MSISVRTGILYAFMPMCAAQAYISPCASDCQRRVEEKFNAAKDLEREQEFDAAAEKYAEVIAEEPLSLISQDSAMRGGRALEKAGKFVGAVAFYENAISIADSRSDEEGTKGVVLKRTKRDALFHKARALDRAGQTEASLLASQQAVDVVFADLAAEPASTTMRQDSAVHLQVSALEAAAFLETTDTNRAIAAYDHVIAIADARADTADGENLDAIIRAKCDALLRKADFCQRAGQADPSRQAIQRLRAEFPVALQTVRAGVIEARLDGQSTQVAEQRVAQELQAKPILDEALLLSDPVTTNVSVEQLVSCSTGADGTISVKFKVKAGKCTETFWNIWVNDATGKNLARWYGSGTAVRGRIGTTSIVTPGTVQLTGAWDEFGLKIRPAANQTEFLFNGESLSILSYQTTGAGDAIGSIRLERIDNPLANDGLLQIDYLIVSPGGNVNACLAESFDYPNGPLRNGNAWTGNATNEIEITDGILRFNGRRYARYEESLVLLDHIIDNFPNTAVSIIALEKKARVLGNLKRIEEAKAAFVSVLDSLRSSASRSEFFKSIRIRLKHMITHYLVDEIVAGRPPTAEKWDELRAICTSILEEDSRSDERAQALVTISETFSWQGKFSESLEAAEQFLAKHDASIYPYATASAHLYAGMALQALHRHQDALVHLQWLMASPTLDANTPSGKSILSRACSFILASMNMMGASEEEINNQVSDCQSKFGS